MAMKNLPPALSILLIAALTALSCATTPPAAGPPRPESLSRVQEKLVEAAYHFEGAETLKVGRKTFRMDCSGVISAIYAYADIDIVGDLGRYDGNGVARLYQFLGEEDLLYDTTDPVPGDIIFWDNTWDANDDGRFNDYFTHVGMVVNRLPDRTVEYIHHNYRKGVVLERMNLHTPNVRTLVIKGERVIINAPLRARNSPPAPGSISLASQLYRKFGMAYLLK